MDKNAIKKYAVWARKELISRVAQKAQQYGITETEMVDAGADSVNGRVLTAQEMQQRRALIAQINEKGYQQVMEEVAYTWFNRFSALRFMEVNGYLPSHVRVFTDENNAFKPQILAEALHLELDKLDKDKVYALKETEQTEELYKYLLIVQCNALNSILPGMFQTIADYTELLLPDNLLREGSVIEQMISQIPEDNWQDAVQIIGWLYQYYNSEKKDDVFAALKKNVKITKENIPAATQLFTPDWIVRYMVENSLGRLWVEGHPDTKTQLLPTPEEQAAYTAGNRDPEDTKWHYYLEEAQQEPQVQAQLSEISKQYADLTPEQIKVIDPCCGSGHILAYLFDVLMQIYENYGYTPRDAVTSILQNNLYGLDIDDRAAQLAYFAVMMKARRYDRRFFSHTTQPHVYAIEESNRIEKPDQGDNLLLARVNLLLTYAEHLQARWQRKPTKEELQPIANIISWNLWQMDGLHLSVPGGKPQPEAEQLDLFSMFGTVKEQTPAVSCKVKNWRSNKTQNFETIQKGSTSMKFDYVIGIILTPILMSILSSENAQRFNQSKTYFTLDLLIGWHSTLLRVSRP